MYIFIGNKDGIIKLILLNGVNEDRRKPNKRLLTTAIH